MITDFWESFLCLLHIIFLFICSLQLLFFFFYCDFCSLCILLFAAIWRIK